MRIKPIITAIVIGLAAIAATTTISGCTVEETRKKAVQFEDTATRLTGYAQKIRHYLDEYDAGRIEENQLAFIVASFLPEEWEQKYRQAVILFGDIRTAASDIADSMDVTAETSLEKSIDLHAQADDAEGKWENFTAILGAVINTAAQPEGVIMAGLAGIATLLGRQKSKEKKRADENQQLAETASKGAIRMKSVATALVGTVEAMKATPGGQAEWPGVRAVVSRTHTKDVQDFVSSTKPTIANKGASGSKAYPATTVPVVGTVESGSGTVEVHRAKISEHEERIRSQFDTTPPPPGPEDYDENGNAK